MSEQMTSKKIEITPEGSIVPIYLDPTSPEEMAARQEAHLQELAAAEEKTQKKAEALAKLTDLGLTLEHLKALGL